MAKNKSNNANIGGLTDNEQTLACIQKQNDVIIGLLARLVWSPEKLAELIMHRKKNAASCLTVYNLLDGMKTGRQLASTAGVTQQAISYVLQLWEEQGIVMNVGTESQPRYKRLMSVPRGNK